MARALKRWPAVEDWSTENLSAWMTRRLREVRAKTVRVELSTLRCLVRYLAQQRVMGRPPELPTIPSGATGTPTKKRRTRQTAPYLTRAEVLKLIRLLPKRSERGRWPIRARFVVAYETTLRPATLDKLRVPENYSRGASVLRIRDSDDKEGAAREVPLTPLARRALDSVCPDLGLIFGSHKYEPYWRAAAERAMPPEKARIVCGQHLRSAAITHLLDAGAGLSGVAFLAGHRRTSTTDRYVRPSFKAAEAALRKRDR